MKYYRDYLRNTLLMTVLTVGLFFVMPQSRVLAEEGEENKQEHTQEDANLNVNNQTDQLPGGTVSLLATSTDPEVVEDESSTEGTQQTSGESQGTENPGSNEGDMTSGTPADTSGGSNATPSSEGGETQDNGTPGEASPTAGGEVAQDTGSSESSGNPSQQDLNPDSQAQSGEVADGSAAIDTLQREGSETPSETETAPGNEGEQPSEAATESLSEDVQKKLSVSAIPASVSNDETVVEAVPDKSSDSTYIEGVTYMSSRVYDYDIPVRFQYSDQYFERDSLNGGYDTDLATLSAIAAGTTSGSNRAKGYVYNPETDDIEIVEKDFPYDDRFVNSSKNVQEFLRQIGFSNIEVNESYTKMGTPISAGVALGMKKITDSNGKEYTLISVLPRSTSYFGEWANSMEIGGDNDEDYQGINQAVRDDILGFLQTYLTDNKIQGDVKIWTAGLSRGGALVNLTAGYLDQELTDGYTDHLLGIDGINLYAKDIFAYTFGSPNAASHTNASITVDGERVSNPIYDNIHNFAATYDVVVGALTGSWPTTRYGYGNDQIVNTEECLNSLEDLIKFYAVTNNKTVDKLTSSNYYMYVEVDEEGNKHFHYAPVEYSANYVDLDYNYREMNLEDFIKAYMTRLTDHFSRKEFADKLQTGLMFFGETYYGYPDEIKRELNKDALIAAAKAKGTEVAMEAVIDLLSGNISALNDLLKYVLDPTKVLPDIVLDTMENIGMAPLWDLKNHKTFEEEGITAEKAREINRGYVVGLVKSIFSVGISDPLGLYNLYRAYGTMWASHELDVDLSWLHLRDSEENQNYYLNPVTEGESWGYRMVTLPDTEGMTVIIYEGHHDFDLNNVKAAVIDNMFYRTDENADYYIRMNIDSDGNRILFLRADREYTIDFVADTDTTTKGLNLIEYEFMASRLIYDPVIISADDYGVKLDDIVLVSIEDEDSGIDLADRLLFNLGYVPVGNTNEHRILLMRNAAEETSEHSANYYTLTKMIQVGALASIGGAVEDRIQNLFFNSDSLTDEKSVKLVATAASGYRFLGWYLNGELISTDSTFSRTYSFLKHSELLTARFELIPVPPKPDPKPDPKPAPSGGGSSSSSTIVEVAAVTNGQITPAVKTAGRNKIPNTGDTENAIWLFWMVLGLAGVAGSAYMLKED